VALEQTKDFIRDNLNAVQTRITEAALRGGRDPDEITLVAVTKTFPAEAIVAAWEAGQRHFGENRPEEGAQKIPQVMRSIAAHQAAWAKLVDGAPSPERKGQAASSPTPIWHMIGHIQSRKTDIVATHFDFVHSVDRYKIARRLSALGDVADRRIPILLECNVSGEASKYGYAAAGWEHDTDLRAALLEEARQVAALSGVQIAGLMTVAPFEDDPESVRPVFASLRALRNWLREEIPNVDWRHLSMGMTSDYEVAVEEGATLVRIGRAIFGARHG
jgi:PLP dependent protein